MRVWLDATALAARGLTVADVEDALERENVELPAGRIESTDRDFTLRVQRGYREPEDFAQLPLAKGEDGYVVRLGDVARVERAAGRAPRVLPQQRRAERRPRASSRPRPRTASTSRAPRAPRPRRSRRRCPRARSIFVAFDTTVFIDAAVERVST